MSPMDLFFLALSLLLIFVSITLIIFTYKTKTSAGSHPATKLPPGSFGWPFIGETLKFLYCNPEKFIHDRMHKHSSEIFKTNILGKQMAVVCGPSGHKFLFSNKDRLTTVWRTTSMNKLFRSHSNNNNNAAHHEPESLLEDSEESRVLLQPAFLKPKALMGFLPIMNSITQNHMDTHWNLFPSSELGDHDQQNIVKVFPLAKRFTLTLACQLFLGLDDPDRVVKLVREFDVVTEGLHSVPVDVPGTAFYRAKRAAGAIRRELRLIMKEKKAAMAGGEGMRDVLSHMIGLTDGSGRFLGEGEIADKMMGLLIAGYSTVASAITFLIKYTGENSHVYDEILKGELTPAHISDVSIEVQMCDPMVGLSSAPPFP